MVCCRQYNALMYKNWLLKKRRWKSTCFEILLPVLIMLVMVGIRGVIKRDNFGPIWYPCDGCQEPIGLPKSSDNSNNITRLQLAMTGTGLPTNFIYQGMESTERYSKIFIPYKIPFNTAIWGVAVVMGDTPERASFINTIRRHAIYTNITSPTSSFFYPLRIETFDTHDEFQNYMTSSGYGFGSRGKIWGAWYLTRVGTAAAPQWEYTIRLAVRGPNQDPATIETTGSEVNRIQVLRDQRWLQLYQNGFTWFQHIAENHFLKTSTGLNMVRTFSAAPFPTPPYINDQFTTAAGNFLGIFFTIVYLWPVTRIVKLFVDEKEMRIKEGMRMMGLHDAPWLLSHLMTAFTITLLTSFFITLVTSGTVFKFSSKIFIWFFFFIFGMSVFSFGFLMSVFFSRSRIATTFSAILFFAFFFPYFAVSDATTSTGQKMLAGLSPPIAFALGSVCIAEFEATGKGIQSDNVNTESNNIAYNQVIGMLLVDFFGYLILGLYFDRVIKTEWGTRLPWYFPVTRQFWCPRRPIPDAARAAALPGQPPHEQFHDQNIPNDMIEAVSEETRANVGVSIQKLRKEFVIPNAGKDVEPQVAVRDVSLDLYTNQILALLGHNGAGKTTMINMLCGLMPPTSGDADVFGAKVSYDMPTIRESLGVCPQHNILFEDLTVQEHLDLYCAIKGVPRDQTKGAVRDMIEQVGLVEKINDQSESLSGGMKRKLSVGIALIGNSKIVFLDEPTSGMDPYSRRATWDLLKKKKEGRVIILTTHFMDEADQLGDRIAIMATGSIKCCGSSLFLKSRYGVGYTMTITKTEIADVPRIDKLVRQHVPEAEQLSNVAGEVSYRLPLAASGQFADMFEQIDAASKDLGIDAYGISVTTLEEVFLRVGHEAHHEEALERERKKNGGAPKTLTKPIGRSPSGAMNMDVLTPLADDEKTYGSIPRSGSAEPVRIAMKEKDEDLPAGHGMPLPHVDTDFHANRVRRTLRALLIKRWHNAKRDRKGWSWTILYPFLILLLGVAITTNVGNANQKPLTLTTGTFNVPNPIPYQYATNTPYSNISSGVIEQLNRASIVQAEGKLIPTPTPPAQIYNYDPFRTNDNELLSRYLLNQICDKYAQQMVPKGISTSGGYDNPSECSRAWLNQYSTFFATSYTTIGKTDDNINALNTPAANFSDFTSQFLRAQMNILALNTTTYPTQPGSFQPIPTDFTYDQSNPAPNTYYDTFTLLFNSTVKHGVISAYNLVNNGLLRQLTKNSDASIVVTTWPLPRTFDQKALATSTLAIIVAIAFAFIPASFIGYAVKEDSDKAKHQQMISGVSATTYWASNYIWDFTNYLIPGLLCLLVFGIFKVDALIGENAGATFLSILLYGISIIPFTYILSFLFNDHNTAQNVILLLYILIGACLLIASIVLDLFDSTKDANSHLKFVYRLFPSFCFGECIVNLIVRGSPTAFGRPRGIWDMDVVGWPMIFMAWESVVYVIILYLIEFIRARPGLLSKFQRKVPVEPTPYEDDEDVQRERERVKFMNTVPKDGMLLENGRDMITLSGLRKVYPSAGGGRAKVAVHDLWLGIPEGECFGYLGINGAGKTTTLKMLTADIIPTAGTGYLGGHNMLTEQGDVRKLIGYCPQFDALIDTLTAREHLYLFARIKGIPEAAIPDYVDKLILRLGLQEGIADKPARGYSGGNKRKLCVGMALIGSPKIVFLDEPSTGMDPGSRRFMWDLIASTMKGRSVILTTHSMEEVTALCSRIGIMVGGRLRCLGSTQHLKSRYGDGYQMDVHVVTTADVEPFNTWIQETFPGSRLIEAHSEHLKYEIPKNINGRLQSIGNMFRAVENQKKNLNVQEYSLSETTLEQIFINFAKQQDEEKGPVAGFQ